MLCISTAVGDESSVVLAPMLVCTPSAYSHPLLFPSPHLTNKLNPTDFLAILLSNGISPKTGGRILKSSTVDYMFANHLGPISPSLMRPSPSTLPQIMNTFESWSWVPEPHHWGLSFLVTEEAVKNGRGKGTAEWGGLANTYWWCDRKKGIAG